MVALTSILAIVVIVLIFFGSALPLLYIPNFTALMLVTGVLFGLLIFFSLQMVDVYGLWPLVRTTTISGAVVASIALGRLWHIKHDKQSPNEDGREFTLPPIRFSIELLLLNGFSNISNELNKSVRVTPFVVVPRNNLDEVAANDVC